MSKSKLSLVSLGMSCQTAHQLALFASKNSDEVEFIKGPFDWLICPPVSASNWLDSGLPDFEKNEITIKKGQAWWERYQFWFWHGFYEHSGEERVLNIDATIQREQEKLAYQRSIFAEIDPDNALFFFSNTQNNLATTVFEGSEESLFQLDAGSIQKLQTSLDGYFNKPTRLHWFTRPDRCDGKIAGNLNVHHLKPEASDWKGNADDWNAHLSKIAGI